MSKLFPLTVVITLICSTGCDRGHNGDAKIARSLIGMSTQQRAEVIRGLPVDEQLDVYLYAGTKIEPPLILANEVSAAGPRILTPLKDRLSAEPDDGRFVKLMLILVSVSANDCSLDKREDILAIVRLRVSKMQSGSRDTAAHLLDLITHPEKPMASCP